MSASAFARARPWAIATAVVAVAVCCAGAKPATIDDPRARAASALPQLRLEVLLAQDPDFPRVSRDDAIEILRAARDTLADKLAFSEIDFVIVGETTAADFVARNTRREHDPCVDPFDDLRVVPGKPLNDGALLAAAAQFLSRWRLDELRAFFPEDRREGLEDYESAARKLLAELQRKTDLIAGFRLADGKSLLDAARLEERSYVRWICAIRHQDEADLILTNAFIFYDLASEPYPHSVFQKAKVGGASLHSPKRSAIRNRAVVASTFSMVTDLPFFQEEGVASLTPAQRLEVIGTFIVAHELGHAVFKLPDFYDHPRECLMTTKYETGYVSGYRDVKRYPGACPMCQPYVIAKRHVFAAQAARRAGDADGAIAELKLALQTTPKHIDGSYTRYIGDLSLDIAELYAASGRQAEAETWLGAVLKRLPDHARALKLRATWEGASQSAK